LRRWVKQRFSLRPFTKTHDGNETEKRLSPLRDHSLRASQQSCHRQEIQKDPDSYHRGLFELNPPTFPRGVKPDRKDLHLYSPLIPVIKLWGIRERWGDKFRTLLFLPLLPRPRRRYNWNRLRRRSRIYFLKLLGNSGKYFPRPHGRNWGIFS